jgi:Putative Ig domain
MDTFASLARAHVHYVVLLTIVTVGLAACGGDNGSSGSAASAAASGTITGTDPVTGTQTVNGSTPAGGGTTSPTPSPAPAVGAPTISGRPVTALNVGAAYSFKPTATGPTGAILTFSIQNKPVWATFNAASGVLTGTPIAANAGTYANIIISVSDGKQSASLAAFNVTVTQSSNGTATLDWTPPTENTDGTALTNLAGYHIYYGTSADNLTEVVKVTNPGLTAYTLSNLAPGTWFFSVTSYSSTGAESTRTGIVSATF